MINTKLYRRQHDEIIVLLKDIMQQTERREMAEVARLLPRFNGMVRVHFATEDETLYPALLASVDPQVRHVAEAFRHEMAALSAAFEAFSRRWPPERIVTDLEGFEDELDAIAAALFGRLKRENAQLYTLVERNQAA